MAFRDASEDPTLLTPDQRKALAAMQEQANAEPPAQAPDTPAAEPVAEASPEPTPDAPPAAPPRQRPRALRDELLARMGKDRLTDFERERAENEAIATTGEAPDQPEPQAQPAQPSQPATPTADSDPVETIKIDGREYQVRHSQMLQQMPELGDVDPKLRAKTFQVFAAGQKRLWEANRIKEQVAQAAQASPAPAAPAPAPAEPAKPEPARREKLEGIVKAIQFGNVDEAIDALDKLAPEQPAIDEDKIRRIAAETAARQAAAASHEARRRAEVNDAQQRNKDVFDDPVLSYAALGVAQRVIANDLKNLGLDPTRVDGLTADQQAVLHAQMRMAGHGKTLGQVLDEATSQVRKHPRFAQGPRIQQTEPPSLAVKREAKAQMTPLPTPASARAVIPKVETPTADVGSIVARMNKARGRPVLQ